jgi:MoaD family protein
LVKILVKFFAALAEIMGERETLITLTRDSHIQELFKQLEHKYPQKFQTAIFESNGAIKPSYKILLNDQSIEIQNSSKVLLKDKDVIAFLPPLGGG